MTAENYGITVFMDGVKVDRRNTAYTPVSKFFGLSRYQIELR